VEQEAKSMTEEATKWMMVNAKTPVGVTGRIMVVLNHQ
jgi:hypothetical protein